MSLKRKRLTGDGSGSKRTFRKESERGLVSITVEGFYVGMFLK